MLGDAGIARVVQKAVQRARIGWHRARKELRRNGPRTIAERVPRQPVSIGHRGQNT